MKEVGYKKVFYLGFDIGHLLSIDCILGLSLQGVVKSDRYNKLKKTLRVIINNACSK